MDASTVLPTVGEVCVLRRVGEEYVLEHPDVSESWSAGQRAVHTNRVDAHALYKGRSRVARFCYHRLNILLDAMRPRRPGAARGHVMIAGSYEELPSFACDRGTILVCKCLIDRPERSPCP